MWWTLLSVNLSICLFSIFYLSICLFSICLFSICLFSICLFVINAETDINFKGRRDMIRNDLKRKNFLSSLGSISDFEDLKAIAIDRVKRKTLEKMTHCVQAPITSPTTGP